MPIVFPPIILCYYMNGIKIRIALTDEANTMKQEFEQRREMDVLEAEQEEIHAMRFVKSWHRFPALHDAIWYHGINLGEADEYVLVNPILKALLKQSGKMSL